MSAMKLRADGQPYVALRNNPDNSTESQDRYIVKLQSATDEWLYGETKDMIWLSAYASNNPRSCYHWRCDATYVEWKRRGNVDQYGKAHAEVSRG